MIVRGIDIANPQLNVQSLLSPQAAALYGQIDTKCLGDLGKPDSFGALAPASLFAPGVDLAPVIAALNADDDPEQLRIPGAVRIEQGTADTTVFPAFTEPTAKALKATYKTYDGLTHASVVTSAKPQADATAFLKKRLG
jgi:hypothetical protein